MVIQISQHFKLNFYRSLRPIFFKRLKMTLFFPHVLSQIFLHPGVNFIDVKRAHFSYERLFSSYVLALNELSYKKFARLTLMKLTEDMKSSIPCYPFLLIQNEEGNNVDCTNAVFFNLFQVAEPFKNFL